MSDEARVAALGEEIRQAGHDTRWARRAVAGVVLASFITWGAWGLLLSLEWFDDGRVASLLWLAAACATLAGASCIASGAVAIPAAAVLRGVRRRRLGRRL